LIAAALIAILIFIIIALAVICIQKQAKISSLKKELSFLQLHLRIFMEKDKGSGHNLAGLGQSESKESKENAY